MSLATALRVASAAMRPHVRMAGTAAPAATAAAGQLQELSHKKMVVRKTTNVPTLPVKEELGFGKYFTPHMFVANWNSSSGWSTPNIQPLANLSLHPACSVFHYGLECFEGMKAFRGIDNKIRLFLPRMNVDRFYSSCKRLALPTFDKDEFYKCLVDLVVLEKAWIPDGRGYSMYIRPTMIATQPTLGVAKSSSAMMFVLTGPAGAYWGAHGFKPVKLLADSRYVRAWPGGMGDIKCGGNYAPTIKPQSEAVGEGCQQVLWLFNDQVTEVGTMNLFTFWINEKGKKELITPPLDGTILPGVTRHAILGLTRKWGEFEVSEGNYTMTQVKKAGQEGRLLEMFGAGTAATVSPVEAIKYNGEWINIPAGGKVATRIMDEVFDIQYGKIPSHEWAPIIA